MYYEEKIIDGVLHCRFLPNSPWKKAIGKYADAVNALFALPDDKRLEAFRWFCLSCGSDDPHCVCGNDD